MSTVVSPDALLMEGGKYNWTPQRCAEAWEKADALLDEVLPSASKLVLMVGIPASGKSTWLAANREEGAVYFDATMTKTEVRARYVRKAKALGKPVEAVVMLTNFATCMARNNARPEDRVIPPATLNILQNQLREQPVLTTEGFHKITPVFS